MKETEYAFCRLLSAIYGSTFLDFRVLPIEPPLVGIPTTERGAVHMTRQSDEFHPQAVRRMFLAVVNQAIFDVLENNEDAKAAEQWLLSRDFDSLAELLSCEAEIFGHDQQQAVA